jgi:hypothetical protein
MRSTVNATRLLAALEGSPGQPLSLDRVRALAVTLLRVPADGTVPGEIICYSACANRDLGAVCAIGRRNIRTNQALARISYTSKARCGAQIRRNLRD